MGYPQRPLFPPMGDCCAPDNCVRVPLFSRDVCRPPNACPCAQTVRLENPCCPGECAEVALSVDGCGNLVMCVHREPCCPPPRPRRWCR